MMGQYGRNPAKFSNAQSKQAKLKRECDVIADSLNSLIKEWRNEEWTQAKYTSLNGKHDNSIKV